eukprot:scpid74043/ scgid30513/ 
MESEVTNDLVQRRLFNEGSTPNSSPVPASTLDNGLRVPKENSADHQTPRDGVSRSFTSIVGILALLAAVAATYVVEAGGDGNVFLSAPAQLAVVALLWGCASFAFTWWYTYFDSHDPGSFPSSPLKLATTANSMPSAGAQWHFSYIMAPVNGVMAMLMYIYWKLLWPGVGTN